MSGTLRPAVFLLALPLLASCRKPSPLESPLPADQTALVYPAGFEGYGTEEKQEFVLRRVSEAFFLRLAELDGVLPIQENEAGDQYFYFTVRTRRQVRLLGSAASAVGPGGGDAALEELADELFSWIALDERSRLGFDLPGGAKVRVEGSAPVHAYLQGEQLAELETQQGVTVDAPRPPANLWVELLETDGGDLRVELHAYDIAREGGVGSTGADTRYRVLRHGSPVPLLNLGHLDVGSLTDIEPARREKERLLAQLRLAIVVPARHKVPVVNGEQLVLEPSDPAWSTGPAAGSLGQRLNESLSDAFAAERGCSDVELALVPSGDAAERKRKEEELPYLRWDLEQEDEHVSLHSSLLIPGGEDGYLRRYPLQTISFDPAVLGWEIVRGREVPNETIGLLASSRTGSTGAAVHIVMEGPREGTSFCAGDTVYAKYLFGEPMHLRVFNVFPDRSAYQVWPPGGQDDLEPVSVDLATVVQPSGQEGDGFCVTPPTQLGAERLVAIALPASSGADLGVAGTWDGFCKVENFTVGMFPDAAAVDTAVYTVLSPENPHCTGVQDCGGDLAAYEEIFRKAPLCGR